MSLPSGTTATTRQDVYLLCPDLESFRATCPDPLRGVWRTVNNDFGSYKRKQKQKHKKRKKADADGIVTVTDAEAYLHTRDVALRKGDVASASASLPAPDSGPSHSVIEEAFGDACFSFAYWASQDSIGEHRLTGYALTSQQWLKRVVKLIETLGDQSHRDAWNLLALSQRPFDDHHIVEAGRTAALPSRPDAAELIQRQVTAALQQLLQQQQQRPVVEEKMSQSTSSQPIVVTARVDEEEEKVDYELIVQGVAPSPVHSASPPVAIAPPPARKPMPELSANRETMSRMSFNSLELVNPRHPDKRWRLSYRGKGTFAQVYVGMPIHGVDTAQVAIKFALDPSSQNIDQQLMQEAVIMERVARVSPNVVCQPLFQPRSDDPVITMESGIRQPVFIAMELVDCDFGELERSGHLSRCAMCEGFLMSFLALQGVHRSGVLHRDAKLNNIAFCVKNAVSVAAARPDVSGRNDLRLSSRILDFGEAIPLRVGDRGPRDYGRCRSEYASIARHNEEEQGFKDDLEMLLYSFLDKLMVKGLPWKQHSPRLPRHVMRDMKVSFRQFQGHKTEMYLVSLLHTLDSTRARDDAPYQAMEDALRWAWENEWKEHHSHKPRRLYDCINSYSKGSQRVL